MNLNNIPSKGKFGDIVASINSNFDLLNVAVGDLIYSVKSNKGMFASAAALSSAIPSPSIGDWALVGEEFPLAVYVCRNTGTWVDSTQTYSGDNVNLNDYLTISDFNTYKNSTDAAIEALQGSEGNYEYLIKGKNLFTIQGYIQTNGAVSSSNAYYATDFLPVLSTADIFISNGFAGNSSLLVAFYNESKGFLSGINNATEATIAHSSINPLAKYVRFGTSAETVNAVQLSISTTADILKELRAFFDIQPNEIVMAGIFSFNGYIDTDGIFRSSDSYRCSDYIGINRNVDINVSMGFSGQSSLLVAFYKADKSFISGVNNTGATKISAANIPPTAAYVRFGTSADTVSTIYVSCTSVLNEAMRVTSVADNIKQLSDSVGSISDKEMRLSVNGYYRVDNGALQNTENAKNTGLVPIEGRNYLKYNANITAEGYAVAFFDSAKNLLSSISVPGSGSLSSGTINLHAPSYQNASYAAISYYDTAKQYPGYEGIIYNDDSLESRVRELEKAGDATAKNLKILIFGDSITDCATINITNNRTTYYKLNGNSNSYTKNGVTKTFSMWPYLLSQRLENAEIRNYAKSGASYKDATRQSGDERQNLSYQITVALNDLSNPNSAFPTTGTFEPDIVIFALGVNDGEPNDNYASAMSKTVTTSGGFDVASTLSNLDKSKFCESARWAFLKVIQQFPTAMRVCVLPIQRASLEQPENGVNDELEKMAKRYGFRIIDGSSEIGVVRDFEINNNVGVLLKDGLHPNDLGQNLFAKRILAEIKNYYVDNNKLNT